MPVADDAIGRRAEGMQEFIFPSLSQKWWRHKLMDKARDEKHCPPQYGSPRHAHKGLPKLWPSRNGDAEQAQGHYSAVLFVAHGLLNRRRGHLTRQRQQWPHLNYLCRIAGLLNAVRARWVRQR
jgi:hypothetical protein